MIHYTQDSRNQSRFLQLLHPAFRLRLRSLQWKNQLRLEDRLSEDCNSIIMKFTIIVIPPIQQILFLHICPECRIRVLEDNLVSLITDRYDPMRVIRLPLPSLRWFAVVSLDDEDNRDVLVDVTFDLIYGHRTVFIF